MISKAIALVYKNYIEIFKHNIGTFESKQAFTIIIFS